MENINLRTNIFNEQVKEEESALKVRKNFWHYARRKLGQRIGQRTPRHARTSISCLLHGIWAVLLVW